MANRVAPPATIIAGSDGHLSNSWPTAAARRPAAGWLVQWTLVSPLALTPIDSAALAYQLSDLKPADRLAVLRRTPFAFLDFEFSGFDQASTYRKGDDGPRDNVALA